MTGPSIPVEILIEQQIAAEVEDHKKRLDQIDTRAFELTDQCDAAQKVADESGRPEDLAEYEHLHRQLNSYINAGIQLSQKIQTLRSPAELERRVNDKLANQQSLRRLLMSDAATETKTTKPTQRDLGVPDVYLREDGKSFLTGMDARYKSDLVNSALGLITEDAPGESKMVFEAADAEARLEKRGWSHFLARKREIEDAKAAKKAAAQEVREAKQREAAAAKEQKAAEKKAAQEAKQAEAEAKKAEAGDAKATGGKSSGKSSGGTSKADQMRQQREAAAAAS